MSKYNYRVINQHTGGLPVFTSKNFSVVEGIDLEIHFISVEDEKGTVIGNLFTKDQIEEWRQQLEKSFAWSQKVESAVTPSYYQNYIDEYQWIDVMSRLPTMKEPSSFIAALELQIRKYLDRNGQKDNSLQELKKARFYLQYMIMYIENNNKPILAKDVQKIFEDK